MTTRWLGHWWQGGFKERPRDWACSSGSKGQMVAWTVGSDALVRLSVEEVRDPQNANIVLQHSIPSGIQALCNSLKDAFGVSDQEMVSQSIEAFFGFRRGKMSFPGVCDRV